MRRCVAPACPQYHRPYRPEEELGWALPHGEFGLDVIALVGALRFREHRSVPEIHQHLRARGLVIAERTVTNLLERYEELLAVTWARAAGCGRVLAAQERVILAIDGLQPDVGHEVLWVVRDCLSGEVLLARSLLSGREADLAALLREVQAALAAVPVASPGVVSDGQHSIRKAVAQRPAGGAPPAVPLPLPARGGPADLRGRPPRQEGAEEAGARRAALSGRWRPASGAGPAGDPLAAAVRGYCLAVRSALTDDGRPPLAAAGLRLRERLTAIRASIGRVQPSEGRGAPPLPRELSPARPPARPRPGGDRRAVAAHRGRLRLGAPGGALLGNDAAKDAGAVRARYARLLAEMRARRAGRAPWRRPSTTS